MMKRLTQLENIDTQAFAASILLFDKIEMERLITIFSKITIIDYNLKYLIDIILKLHSINAFDNLPKDLDERIKFNTNLIETEIKALTNTTVRDKLSLWFNHVKEINITPQLAENLMYQYCWAEYLHRCSLADSDDMDYKDKLALRPIIPDLEDETIKPITDIVIDTAKKRVFETGVTELDNMVTMEESNFVVIAAPTSMGKSLFMLNQAIMNAKHDKVLYISLEENEQEIKKRINSNTEKLSNNDKELIGNNFFLFCPSTSNPNVILPVVEDKIKSMGIHVVFIDYLQLLKLPECSMFESLREVTRMLKLFGVKNNCLVITASQIRRDAEVLGQSLSSLFGSSSIEFDANVVLLLEAKAKDKTTGPVPMTITVAKNRSGVTGNVSCMVDYQHGRILSNNDIL